MITVNYGMIKIILIIIQVFIGTKHHMDTKKREKITVMPLITAKNIHIFYIIYCAKMDCVISLRKT